MATKGFATLYAYQAQGVADVNVLVYLFALDAGIGRVSSLSVDLVLGLFARVHSRA